MLNYARNNRQTPEASDYWSVYLVGIYEYGSFFGNVDNDTNDEFGLMGWTNVGATGGAGGDKDNSFIPMEIIADVADQWGWTAAQRTHVQQVVAVHESGHQFELAHTTTGFPGTVMTAPPAVDASENQVPQIQLQFNEANIEKIRHQLPTTGP